MSSNLTWSISVASRILNVVTEFKKVLRHPRFNVGGVRLVYLSCLDLTVLMENIAVCHQHNSVITHHGQTVHNCTVQEKQTVFHFNRSPNDIEVSCFKYVMTYSLRLFSQFVFIDTLFSSTLCPLKYKHAPGEARTHNLGIALQCTVL